MKAFVLISAIFMTTLLSPAPASQARSPIGPEQPEQPDWPAGRHPCFQQLVNDLIVCGDEFCDDEDCNGPLLAACILGARDVYRACMDDWAG